MCVACHAQAPKAVIVGPKDAVSGDMVILDATQSQGQKFIWKMIWLPGEEQKSFLPVDNNMKCIFAAGVDAERIFHFVLIAAGTNPNGGPEVDVATHDLAMKPRNAPPRPKPDPTNPPSPSNPGKVTRVTYVYEKDQNAVPRQVASALQRINADSSLGVVATEFENDTTDGTGDVPDQYKIALDAARKAGLPALVAQAGDSVVRVISNPKTETQVLEVVQ
jgi:hypothetical protein